MQYSAEAWMSGLPLPYCTSGDVQRFAHLAPPGDAGMAGWSPPPIQEIPPPGAYLQQAYMPMPDYRQAAAAAGLTAYPPMFDYSQLSEAQLAAHLCSTSQPSLAAAAAAASPQLLSVNPRSKLSLGSHRPLPTADDRVDDDDDDDALLAAQEHIEAELPTTAAPHHYLNKASLQVGGQLPYGPALQQFRPYPHLRHAPPALVPYHAAYPYPNPLSQPPDFDDTAVHDPSLAASPPVLPSQPSLSRPGPSNAEVAQQLGDDIADHFVRVERKITCPTYCKRLHVTQFMAENLLPTDQNKDRAKGPLCYNYELLFKHKIWLIDEDLVSWPVEYEGVVCCAQRHYRLTSGWRNFVRAKNIKVGDTVVMERRGRNRHNVYVKVVEGTATPATPPKAKGPRLKAALARNDDTLEAPDAALASP